MLQHALYFCLFVGITLFLFYKTKYHVFVLFFASLLFIAFIQWRAIPLLLLNSLFCFYLGQRIAIATNWKNTLFVFGVALILCELFSFKYVALSEQNLSGFSFEAIAFTLGFSFYSLQNIAYLFDIKIGRIVPEERSSYYVLANMYFPKILCGPLVNYQVMKKKLIAEPVFKQENIIAGTNRFVVGALKKLILADRLAPMAAAVFDSSDGQSGFTVLFAGFVFIVHVYFDFSGYTDMALGISRMFGIVLPENFSTPFRALSITQFWRKWHITLMQWLAQYVYYPVSYFFRKNVFFSTFAGIIVTLFFSAVWHGIGLTFLLWGLCHATYLTIELIAQRRNFKLAKAITYPLTLLAISFSYIFFRAPDLFAVKKLMGEIFSSQKFWPEDWLISFIGVFGRGADLNDLFNFFIAWIFVMLFLLFENKINQKASSEKLSVVWLVTCILLIAVFGIFNSGEEFIYARF